MSSKIDERTLTTSLNKQNRMPQQRKTRATDFTAAKRQKFLDALALTCNVMRSAAHAGVSATAVYANRSRDPHFAEQWREAFASGYDRLEALVLEHGGAGVALEPADPQRAEAEGAVAPFDFDKAMKVLHYHRAARDGARPTRGRRRTQATREETNAALMKALAAARRRIERVGAGDA